MMTRVRGRGRTQESQEQFSHEVGIVKAQIANFRSRWIVHPRFNKWTQQWDMTSFACILFTAVVTPFEIGISPTLMLWEMDAGALGLFAANRVVDVFFLLDLVLNFFLAYQEDHTKGGQWVTNHRQITRRYLQSWFVVDFFSVLPFDLLISFGLLEGASLLRITRTVRLLRLMKLLRIVRASRLLARWQLRIGLSFAHLTMIRFMLVTCFLVHLMACTWAWAGLNGNEELPNRCLGSFEECWGVYPMKETSWIVNNHLTFAENPSNHQRLVYLVSFTQAVSAMFGSIGPIAPGNFFEYIIVTLMMLFGSMVWAWVIGSLCGILATLNPHTTHFRNQMDELNYFMRMNDMPQGIRERLREYFRMTQDYERQHAYDGLLHKMSIQLRGDTALQIGVKQLAAVWYFHPDPASENLAHHAVEKEFLSVVALNLTTAAYEQREILPTFDLTIIDRGVATLRLVMLTKGKTFGKDCVMDERFHHWRSNKAAFSLTFLQTSSISRRSLFTLVQHFPNAQKRLRSAAARYTIAAAFRNAFAGFRLHRNDRSSAYTAGHAALAHYSGSMNAGHRGTMSSDSPADSFVSRSLSGRAEVPGESFKKPGNSFTKPFTRQATAASLQAASLGLSRLKSVVRVAANPLREKPERRGDRRFDRYLDQAELGDHSSHVQCVAAEAPPTSEGAQAARDDVYSMKFAFSAALRQKEAHLGMIRHMTRRMDHVPVLADSLPNSSDEITRLPHPQSLAKGARGGRGASVFSGSSSHMHGSTGAMEADLQRLEERIQSHISQQIESLRADVKADIAGLTTGFERAVEKLIVEGSRTSYSKGSPATDGLDDMLDERSQRPTRGRRRRNNRGAVMSASTPQPDLPDQFDADPQPAADAAAAMLGNSTSTSEVASLEA